MKLLIVAAVGVFLVWATGFRRTELAQEPRSLRGQGGSMGNERLYNPARLTDSQRHAANIIADVAYGAGLNPAFLIALAVTESSLRPEIVGDDGVSIGLFQIQLRTAREVSPAVTKTDLLDPLDNALVAVRVLELMRQRYPGHRLGEYAEAWALGGRGKFVLGRALPVKVANMQRAILDLDLRLDLNEVWT